jgi:hypothetical protein
MKVLLVEDAEALMKHSHATVAGDQDAQVLILGKPSCLLTVIVCVDPKQEQILRTALNIGEEDITRVDGVAEVTYASPAGDIAFALEVGLNANKMSLQYVELSQT